MKKIYKLLFVVLTLLFLLTENGFAANADNNLPAQIKDLRKDIRRELMARAKKFDTQPYQIAPVNPKDSTMKDACFRSMSMQDKTVNRGSNGDLKNESTLTTDIDTVIGSVSDKCMPMRSTAKFSPLDLNKWYLTSIIDPTNPQKYYRSSGDSGSLYRAESSEGGNRLKNASRLVRPDSTMLNGCSIELMVNNASGPTKIDDPIWMRRELDNCLNQYILQHGRFPRINEDSKASYFGINVGLCQPLQLLKPPSKYDLYEYAPSEYLGVAWRKLLVDHTYKKTNNANAEPNYEKHSKVKIIRKIEMPESNFGQILVEDLAEKTPQVDLHYEKILDPSHPFSPRWDYKTQDRSLSFFPQLVRCAEVPVDIMTFRQGPFEASISKKIIFNIICSASFWCRKFNKNCSVVMGNQCCSTDYRFKDKVNGLFRRMCGLPIVDGCNFIARPLTPINTLKMREVNGSNFQGGSAPEGYNFKDYFGKNKPYMRCWDTNTECGENMQTFPVSTGLAGLAGSISPAAASAFQKVGISNLDDIKKIATAGINPQLLQKFAQSAGLGNLQQLATAGLNGNLLNKLGNLSQIANIPNINQLTNLAKNGLNLNSLVKLPNLNIGNISSITNLVSSNIPTNLIQQITSLPTNVAGNIPQLINQAAGNPQALISKFAQQGVNITSGTANQILSQATQISNAINSGKLPLGIPGGINASQISSLQGLISGGIDPSQIVNNILPNIGNLGSAFSGLGAADFNKLSNILSNPTSLANLNSLANLSGLENLGIPVGQIGDIAGLLSGGLGGGLSQALVGDGALSPSAVSALAGASTADVAGLGSFAGLGGGGGTASLLYNPFSTKGSNYAIQGAGREGESCMIGGGKGLGGLANPDPITSWSELKLYYVRAMRMNVKCIANHEKLFKYSTGEGGLLRSLGQSIPIREQDSQGNYSTFSNVEMPFPWLGYLSDPKPAQRFPNFGNANVSVQNLGTGLDGALPNDVLVFGADLVRTGNNATDRNPYVGIVANADNQATRAANGGGASNSLEFVKIRAYNHGKYLDACGNTDMLGDSTIFTIFKTGLPQQYVKMFQTVAGKNVPPNYHCLDPALSACIEPLWNNIPRYKIESAY